MPWEDLSTLQNVFLGCAIVGGGLFLLRSILLVIGMGGDDHGVADGDVGDAPVATLKMVTIHGLTAFLLMFGLVGYLILRNDAESIWLAVTMGSLAGLVTMFILAKMFQSSRKLQADGTIYPRDIIGLEGAVYLVIRPGGIGKVQVTVRNAMKVFDARAKDTAVEIKTGQRVRVVEAADVLIVEEAEANSQ